MLLASLHNLPPQLLPATKADDKGRPFSTSPMGQYSIMINATPLNPTSLSSALKTTISSRSAPSRYPIMQRRRNRAVMEAKTVAWRYNRYAILFLISFLDTWNPSTIDRVYSLVYRGASQHGTRLSGTTSGSRFAVIARNSRRKWRDDGPGRTVRGVT